MKDKMFILTLLAVFAIARCIYPGVDQGDELAPFSIVSGRINHAYILFSVMLLYIR